MEFKKVAIVSACRTPFDKFGGVMKSETTVQLGSFVVKEAMKRAGIDPSEVEETYIGINMPSGNRSIARQITLEAGMPPESNSTTCDRACCSSMVAIAMAMRAIQVGAANITVCGGSENMSNVPYFIQDLRWGKRMGHIQLNDLMVVSCPYTHQPRAQQASEAAEEFGITREMQDEWVMKSQQRYAAADAKGIFDCEIIPYTVAGKKGDVVVTKDVSPRPDTTMEVLAKLKPVNGAKTVTAGNAPGLNTGATALVLMSEEEVAKRGIEPIAWIIAHAQASGHPKYIATIPAFGALKALKNAGLTIDDIDVIEINEAFAVMPLASNLFIAANGDQELAMHPTAEVLAKAKELGEKTNINGGAIAIGHPTGATGGRIVMTAAYELQRRGHGRALITICGGVGETESFILER
ncbi:MAG: thiolase family protein [Oscillospiraceae bacterium]|nr:thiolase family protein [Oscillospiraceae bacterium]